jgi:hypothetical protein
LICRHCSQWNPDGDERCCFCDNLVAGGEDSTASGQPAYLRNVQTTGQLPPVVRSEFDRPIPENLWQSLWELVRRDLAKAAAVLAVVLLVVLAGLCSRC